MATSNQLVHLANAVIRLTADRKNRTTGPGHYVSPALNALSEAMYREGIWKVRSKVNYPDRVDLTESYF